jgi:hypothetical protein
MVDLEDFTEQIDELLNSIRNVLDKDIPRLKGQERIEVRGTGSDLNMMRLDFG